MQYLYLFSILALVASAAEIIGWNGQEAQTYSVSGGVHFAGLKKHRLNKIDESAQALFDSLKSVSEESKDVQDRDGILDAMRLLARKAYESHDVEKATVALDHLESSLTYVDSAGKPTVNDAAAKMRANMCLSRPQKQACQDFMKEYCQSDKGKQLNACQSFKFDKPVEEKKEEKSEQAEQKPADQEGGMQKDWIYNDGVEKTDDWRQEYGPKVQDTYRSVCMRHPHNDWCQMKYGAGLAEPREASSPNHTALWVIGGVMLGMALTTLVMWHQGQQKDAEGAAEGAGVTGGRSA